MIPETLQVALQTSWTADTSASPDEWTEDNPAWGQCAVTALVVQDYLGGQLMRGLVTHEGKEVSHYFNRWDNVTHDITAVQFGDYPEGVPITVPVVRERDYVLGNMMTATRYHLLKDRVDAFLNPPEEPIEYDDFGSGWLAAAEAHSLLEKKLTVPVVVQGHDYDLDVSHGINASVRLLRAAGLYKHGIINYLNTTVIAATWEVRDSMGKLISGDTKHADVKDWPLFIDPKPGWGG